MLILFTMRLWIVVVFRTNGAIIKGFEEDVGSRTTHYTFSTNTLMNSMLSYAGVGYRRPPVSKVRTEINICLYEVTTLKRSCHARLLPPLKQETRYIFLPDHDRDYLLMKAVATHTLVDRGREKGKK